MKGTLQTYKSLCRVFWYTDTTLLHVISFGVIWTMFPLFTVLKNSENGQRHLFATDKGTNI